MKGFPFPVGKRSRTPQSHKAGLLESGSSPCAYDGGGSLSLSRYVCVCCWCLLVFVGLGCDKVLQGVAQRGGAILLNFCGSLGPFCVQQNEAFLP